VTNIESICFKITLQFHLTFKDHHYQIWY